MKIKAAVLAVVAIATFIIGKPKTEIKHHIYEDSYIAVERTRNALFITDEQTGNEYCYRAKRAKKAINSARTANKSICNDTLIIETVYDIVIVTERETGKILYFKVR